MVANRFSSPLDRLENLVHNIKLERMTLPALCNLSILSASRLSGRRERGRIVAHDRRGFWRSKGDMGIAILILSLLHVPLPQADYHNIRHHDSPGEICGYHDHLLRWHPSANHDADVTMLHWHWFVPIVEFGNPDERPDDDGNHHPGQGPSVHAQLGDWPAPDWHGEPVIGPDSHGRLLDRLTLSQSDASQAALLEIVAPLDSRSGRLSSRTDDPTGTLRAQRAALFQRWNC